jgi:ketosteroid isomerase-like protein
MQITDNTAYSTITCDEDKLALGKQFILAFKNQDWVLLRSIITDDCTWESPGKSELASKSDGAEQVIEKAKRFVEKLNIETGHIQVCLNCVAMAIRNQSVSNEPDLNEHIATVHTMRDGKISSINSFFSDINGPKLSLII